MSSTIEGSNSRPRCRDVDVIIGILPTGKENAITDVPGVKVGHRTRIEGDNIRTGVTVILAHDLDHFQNKSPAAIDTMNGFGKLAGSTQVDELGTLETPIALTNTLAVPTAMNALIRYTLERNEGAISVNAVVGETNDGRLNDIRGLHVDENDVRFALQDAKGGPVDEGNVGAGTGTVAFGYKGGVGTSSRKVPPERGGYVVGVLVQSNYGGLLTVNGVPIGAKLDTLRKHYGEKFFQRGGNEVGSCMIVMATDAPLSAFDLKRLAKRAAVSLGRTGSFLSSSSGDYSIAFSTAYTIPHENTGTVQVPPLVHPENASHLFLAATEATEEALLNSLFRAESMAGYRETREALPIDVVLKELGLPSSEGR